MSMKDNNTIRMQFLHSDEANIFVLGCSMLILWVSVIALLWQIGHHWWLDLLTIGFTELFLGRAAAVAQAKLANIHSVLIVFIATYVDAMTVFILYPMLIFSYRNLFEKRFFQKHMKPVFESAQKGLDRFSGSKIAGVFAFVWFPFWMTGVVVGSILGYLLGLRHWTSMVTVTLGTMSAALCWVLFYDKLFSWLGQINKTIPLAITFVIIFCLAIRRIIKTRQKMSGE